MSQGKRETEVTNLQHLYVFSDSHGYIDTMMHAIERAPEVNRVIFLGDVNQDIEDIQAIYPMLRYAVVQGNNDYREQRFVTSFTLQVEGVQILLCHGHTFGVKRGLDVLARAAESQWCQLALYGHTHMPHMEQRGSLTLVNPGSCCSPIGTYCKITVDGDAFTVTHYKGDGSVYVLR